MIIRYPHPKTKPVQAPTKHASTTNGVIMPRLYSLVRPPGPEVITPPAISGIVMIRYTKSQLLAKGCREPKVSLLSYVLCR
jgi:hypothetical protein